MDALDLPTKQKSPWKRWLAVSIIAAACLYIGQCFNNRRYLHTHCIKQSFLLFAEYAATNDGRFPESERGFADALLQFSELMGDDSWIAFATNGKDDGSYFRNALESGEDIDESRCSRTYVQGLTEASNPAIAMLFDTEAIQGGDHLYMLPGQDRLREVMTVGGSMEKVKLAAWPAFAEQQQQLLLEEGFSLEEIRKLYGSALPKPHPPASQ